MYVNSTSLRVRYAETDQMGVVYNGNYPQYFEVARTEALRSLGLTYRSMEEKGILLPVRKMEIHFKKPARYDDLIEIETIIRERPSRQLVFHHRILNEDKEVLTTARLELVFLDHQSQRPCQPPEEFLAVIAPYFNAP